MRHLLRDATRTLGVVLLFLTSATLAMVGWLYAWWLTPLGAIGLVIALVLIVRAGLSTLRGATKNPAIGNYGQGF